MSKLRDSDPYRPEESNSNCFTILPCSFDFKNVTRVGLNEYTVYPRQLIISPELTSGSIETELTLIYIYTLCIWIHFYIWIFSHKAFCLTQHCCSTTLSHPCGTYPPRNLLYHVKQDMLAIIAIICFSSVIKNSCRCSGLKLLSLSCSEGIFMCCSHKCGELPVGVPSFCCQLLLCKHVCTEIFVFFVHMILG